MVTLGSKVRENITGVEGVALGRCEMLHGCVHIIVEPAGLDKEGRPFELHSFDEQRIEVTEPVVVRAPHQWKTPLHAHVREMHTGFEGVVTARTEWLYSGPRLCIQPNKLLDGKVQKSEDFAEQRCTILAAEKAPVSTYSEATSGPIAGMSNKPSTR